MAPFCLLERKKTESEKMNEKNHYLNGRCELKLKPRQFAITRFLVPVPSSASLLSSAFRVAIVEKVNIVDGKI